jgi:hypothetical protein
MAKVLEATSDHDAIQVPSRADALASNHASHRFGESVILQPLWIAGSASKQSLSLKHCGWLPELF